MENGQGNSKYSGYFSKKLRAGKRRTYFFDVKATKGNDFYLTITESKKRFNQTGYDSHKIFLYKEDFKKFVEGLQETIDHIKGELMPDFDYDNFTRETYYENRRRDDEPTNGVQHSDGKVTEPARAPEVIEDTPVLENTPVEAEAEAEPATEIVEAPTEFADAEFSAEVTHNDGSSEDAMEWN